MDAVTAFYKSIYDDLSVTSEESAELYAFFQETAPEVGALVQTRATAFRVACDYMGDDRDRNVQLMRCVNFVVHAFEQTFLKDKPFELKLPPTVDVAGMDLNEAVQHLWNLDANRLTPNEDYAIDVQSGKKPYWKEDSAPDPLFQRVDGSVFKRPTYKAFTALLDNYSSEIGVAERVTNTERAEVKAFLRAVMQTPCMQFCHQYCQKHGDAPADKAGFSQLLQKIWFDMYRRERGGRLDSSGFEHVFIGEARDGDVTGFHNWIQFYREEKAGNLDYRGYLKPRSRNDAETNGNDHLLTLQFNWAGVEKFAGTFFVGVSPEFELALYTLCFLAGEEENDVDLDTGVDVFGLRYVLDCEMVFFFVPGSLAIFSLSFSLFAVSSATAWRETRLVPPSLKFSRIMRSKMMV